MWQNLKVAFPGESGKKRSTECFLQMNGETFRVFSTRILYFVSVISRRYVIIIDLRLGCIYLHPSFFNSLHYKIYKIFTLSIFKFTWDLHIFFDLHIRTSRQTTSFTVILTSPEGFTNIGIYMLGCRFCIFRISVKSSSF